MAPKRPLDASAEQSGREKKRQKINDARKIQTGTSSTSGAPPVLKQLPVALDVTKFAEARAFEINAMQKTIKSVKTAASSRAWQSLPRHLRRRAASHNVRRVPQRLREKARQEMDPVKKKRLKNFIAKLGKHKRRNRTETLLRRQRDKRWLETHIWHSKRMKMENLWGYRLALHPTEKSFRSSHRASVHGCILHDSSYTAVIELKGELDILKQALSRVCNPHGLSPAAARYTSGARARRTEMFEDSAYPFGFISPVQVLWQPTLEEAPDAKKLASNSTEDPAPNSENEAHRIVWLRFHPAAYEMASRALTRAVTAVLNHQRESGRPSVEVEIADLRGQFNSFELIGPKSSQVIRGALTLSQSDSPPIKKQFWNYLQHLRTPGSSPRSMVIGLKVNDPRLKFPPKNASIANLDTSGPLIRPNIALAATELWSEAVRLRLSRPTFKKKDLDDRRAKQLIPGTALAPLRQDDRIPIILIQQSLDGPVSTAADAQRSVDHSIHGWSIITPLGWGMPFLSSLIFTGTRVGGLREVQSQSIESGLPHFPDDFSGTTLGQESQSNTAREAKEKWERTPPAKRPSYEVLGTRSPFEPDWEVVCGITSTPIPEGYEPTQRMNTDSTRVWLLYGADTRTILTELISADDPAEALLGHMNETREDRGLPPLAVPALELYRGALVLVKLIMRDRGTPSHMSPLYDILPEEYLAMGSDSDSTVIDSHIVGYITTGRQSMSLGKGMGIGAIALSRLVTSAQRHRVAKMSLPHLLKVREAHGEIYRYATVDVI